MIAGRILDVTAVSDLTIGRTVYGAAFLSAANQIGLVIAIPAAVLQEAWAMATPQDYPFLELLVSLPITVVDPLDASAAQRSGIAGADAHAASAWDAGTAHAVLAAHERGWPILTANPGPLHAIDPALDVDILPDT